VYPGKDIVEGDGFLLELPGLIVQIVSPASNDTAKSVSALRIQAHVAMMCGCPIDDKSQSSKMICPELPADQQPWLPDEFEVAAVIHSANAAPTTIPLQFVDTAGTPASLPEYGPAATGQPRNKPYTLTRKRPATQEWIQQLSSLPVKFGHSLWIGFAGGGRVIVFTPGGDLCRLANRR